MSRRRYISTKISLDEKVNKLVVQGGDFAALLYTWMIPHAEDNCRLTGSIQEIIMTIIPGQRHRTPQEVRDALTIMHQLELITWNEEEKYIEFPPSKFYTYQTYIAQDKRKSPSSTDFVTDEAQNTEERRETPQITASFKPSHSVKPSLKIKDKEIDKEIIEPFVIDSIESSPAIKKPRTKKKTDVDETDLHYLAMIAACYSGKKTTQLERKYADEHARSLKRDNFEVSEIPRRAEIYRQKMPNYMLTPRALVGHWSECDELILPEKRPIPFEPKQENSRASKLDPFYAQSYEAQYGSR